MSLYDQSVVGIFCQRAAAVSLSQIKGLADEANRSMSLDTNENRSSTISKVLVPALTNPEADFKSGIFASNLIWVAFSGSSARHFNCEDLRALFQALTVSWHSDVPALRNAAYDALHAMRARITASGDEELIEEYRREMG